jgi:nucleoside-diphosphate-sugar epimerase
MTNKSATVLVTGSEGFFGSWLVPALEEAGYSVVRYDLALGQDLWNRQALASALQGCGAIIHLAAYPRFRQEISPVEFTRRNIIATARLVGAAQEAGVRRLVYTSSGALYGFGPGRTLDGWVQPGDLPINEELLLPRAEDWALLDAYSASKIACEEWLATVGGMAITALRINCIEPYYPPEGYEDAHWGWRCSQALAARAYLAALRRRKYGLLRVNVAKETPHVDRSALLLLLGEESDV